MVEPVTNNPETYGLQRFDTPIADRTCNHIYSGGRESWCETHHTAELHPSGVAAGSYCAEGRCRLFSFCHECRVHTEGKVL